MTRYEYKVVPAPVQGTKAKGLKTPAERFARTLQELMTAEGADGWEYLRAEALPAEERQGLRKKITVYQNLLVFRRPLGATDADDSTPLAASEPLPQLEGPRPDPVLAAPVVPGIFSNSTPFSGQDGKAEPIAPREPRLTQGDEETEVVSEDALEYQDDSDEETQNR